MKVTNNWIMAPSEVFEEYGYIVGANPKNNDRLLSNGQWIAHYENLGSLPVIMEGDTRKTGFTDEGMLAFIELIEPSKEV